MKKSILVIIFLVLVVILVSGCSKNSQSDFQSADSFLEDSREIGNKKGNIAPDFEVQLIDGNTFKLSDYKGEKPVLIEFWATWCPYCKRDFNTVKNIYPEYKNDVEFIAIDLDSTENAEMIREYAEENGLSDIKFALTDTKTLSDYGIRSTTTKFAVSREGIILWAGSGAVDETTWHTIFKGLRDS